MKKLLLLSAVILMSSAAASAQVERATKAKLTQTRLEKQMVSRKDVRQGAVAKAPKKSYATKMYYARPEGTFYESFTSGNNKYSYLVFPNFTDVIYRNMTDEARKAETKWSYVGTSTVFVDADENNDLPDWYAIPAGKLYSVPTLNLDNETFTLGEDGNFAQFGVISTDSINEFCKWDTALGHTYTGYSDGSYGFGTGARTFDFDDDEVEEEVVSDGIVEVFDKPAAPLYLSSITLPVISNKLTREEAFPFDKEMSLDIIKLDIDEEGKWELSEDTLASMPFTADDFSSYYTFSSNDGSYGFLEISQVTVDDFGTESTEPVIINDPFAIVIRGWSQEGIDFGLFFGDAAEASYDFELMSPTYEIYNDAKTSEYKGMLRAYGVYQGAPYCYNAWILLDGMFDVAYVDEVYQEFIAPVEGGIIETKNEILEDEDDPTSAYHDNVIDIYSSLPWYSTWEGLEDEYNYYLVPANEEDDVPDWLALSGISDQYHANYQVNLVQMTAEPLPSGVKGRQCKLKVVSERGAESAVITVTQGEVESEGIETVSIRQSGKGKYTYNLMGQRVNIDNKGIVIRDGKKFIRK